MLLVLTLKINIQKKQYLYISAEKFTQQYIDSVKKNNRMILFTSIKLLMFDYR